MNAIKLLKQQHREVEGLFRKFRSTENPQARQKIVLQCADALAVHATIEEKIFYPASMLEKTEDLLREAVEEHLAVKRVLADLIKDDPGDLQYEAKMTVLSEDIKHHVEEEEESLFPKVQKALKDDRLEQLGKEMETLGNDLKRKGNPREAIPSETKVPAMLPEPAVKEGAKSPRREMRPSL